MNLKDRLLDDLQNAMRTKDVHRRDAIRMVRAGIKNREIELQHELSDEEVQQVISREIKQRAEALEMFEKAKRADLVEKERVELEILRGYLPEQLPADEIRSVVENIIAETGATGMAQLGLVMKRAMAQLKGKADGRLVNEIAREILSQQEAQGR